MQEKVKFLIIRFSSIGDIVLTTPVIRCLKQQVEGAEVHFAIKKRYAELLENNPYVDKVHLLDEKIKPMIAEMQEEGFDYIIDLHKNIRSGLVRSRLKLHAFSFDKLNWKKWMLVNLKINRMPDIHIVDRYMKAVSAFDVKNDGKGLDYFIPDADKIDVAAYGVKADEYYAFAIGGNYYSKRMPPEQIVEVINVLDKSVVLLGGPDDIENGKFIAENTNGKAINLCGELNLNGSASVIDQSALVISHDTGMMHIAAALKKKTISIWGNTVTEFGMYPYLPSEMYRVLEVKDITCRPCSKLGFNRCPKMHFRCMKEISPQMVKDAVDELI